MTNSFSINSLPNNNNNNNNLNAKAKKNNNTKTLTRQEDVKKQNQDRLNLNAVSTALKNFVLQAPNSNVTYDITKSQVLKYYTRARNILLEDKSFLLKVFSAHKDKKFNLDFKKVSLCQPMLTA